MADKYLFPFLLMLACLFACNEKKKNVDDPVSTGPITGIEWDAGSLKRISIIGVYPRLAILADKSLAAVYEDGQGHCAFKQSVDGGATWRNPVIVFQQFQAQKENSACLVDVSNPEIIQLENGEILVACNYRPQKAEITPFAIAVKKSRDNGKTWTDAQVVYEAGERFSDGCWEPSFLQLPNGEIHLYFANEGPYTQSSEQEISLLRSHDNGDTWGDLATVSFFAGSRDGMPVAGIVGNELVVVIEDNHIVDFKPGTVRSTLQDNWSSPVLSNSPNRAYALSDPIPDNVYMGAPYLATLSSGETVISYQTDEGHPGHNTIEVAIGDKNARNFSKRSRPFASSSLTGEWASIIVLDAQTVAVVASMSDGGAWMIKGKINNSI
ncbi:MAG: glycoside hydrolase [Tannerella sp.]|jgi:hypothetical protein|nr:glycoside hydrolase [Tannerella sp.]